MNDLMGLLWLWVDYAVSSWVPFMQYMSGERDCKILLQLIFYGMAAATRGLL
jgi:hypothetical protein